MTPSPRQSWLLPERLGVRIAFALAIALLPLGIISGTQSKSLMDEARARSTAALLGETLLAAGPDAQLIRGARFAAQALSATIEALIDNPAQCSAALKRLLDRSVGAYSYIAYIPVSGVASCTSDGNVRDFNNSQRLPRLINDPVPQTFVIRASEVTQESVLVFSHPVMDGVGAILGYVSISMPHAVFQIPDPDQANTAGSPLQPLALITFDTFGHILSSSSGIDDAPGRLPRDMALADLQVDTAMTFTATSNNGHERVFAVFPLIEDEIYAIGSWPIYVAGDTFNIWVSPYFMPALMWLASLFVAVLAAERLVTRHIRNLRRSITGFADGSLRSEDLDMSEAAVELRDVAEAYLKMTDTIMHDEAELENMVHQREVLLREVHHRVKNNLQLISSIINMQMRRLHSPEAKLLMKGLQDRVMSLATIHRGLYQTSGLADVRADELLSDIVRQILKMSTGPGRSFDVSTDFDDLRLTPDQAVPLSLLLTEALTNAIKYAGREGEGQPAICVSLRRDGATEAVLSVSNMVKDGPVVASPDQGTGLGSKLLAAFSQQLGAQSTANTADGIYTLLVRFTLRSLAEAEARTAPDLDPDHEPDHDHDPEPDQTAD